MSNYFSKVPDFEYVSRLPDANISDYINVKNLFKRVTLKQDIYQDLSFFTKYEINGDDRPDNVAFKEYGRSNLDWVVLTSNNILNIQSEWPMPQFEFDKYPEHVSLKKYNGIKCTYAWKPIIIHEVCEKYGGLIHWMDTRTLYKDFNNSDKCIGIFFTFCLPYTMYI